MRQMNKLAGKTLCKWLILFFLFVSPTFGQIKTITGGGYQFPDGSPCSRCTLTLQLVTDAVVVSTGQIIRRSNTLTYVLDANGNVPANSNLWGNDQLQPNGTTYVATLALPGGGQIWGPEYFSITGTSPISLAQLIPVANPAVYFSNPAVTSLSNVFTQPQTFNSQIVSTVATGTAPFSITSTTVVPNLNAQLHNGLTAPASAIVGVSDSQTLTNKALTSPTLTTPTINGAATGTGVQGTDSALLTSGTVGAGAGLTFCTDANSGATTSGCSGVGAQTSAATNFGANLGTQTVVTSVPSTGLVAFNLVAVQSRAGVGCSAVTNSVQATFSATAPGGTVQNSAFPVLNITGNGAVDTGAGQAGNNGLIVMATKSGTAITYTTSSTLASTGCSTVPQYTVYAKAVF